MKDQIGAIIVTYNPEKLPVLEVLLEQVDKIVIVDNGSQNFDLDTYAEKLDEKEKLQCISLPENMGLAHALNLGMNYLYENAYSWALTLDQDSRVDKSLVKELADYILQSQNPKLVAVGSNIIDVNLPEKNCKYLSSKNGLSLKRENIALNNSQELLAVITSGSLNHLETWKKVGGFREDYFIDYIDIEYCLRLNKLGYSVGAVSSAHLYHCLGDRKSKRIGILKAQPTNHSFLRRYYIARNSIVTLKQYSIKFPRWAIFEVCNQILMFYRICLFEKQAYLKLKYIFLGYFHALNNKLGPYPKKRNV